MLRDFNFMVNTRFIFGHGAHRKAGTELAARGCSKVLICHDSGPFLYSSGLLDQIKKDFVDAGITPYELPDIVPNPRLSKVYEGIELARREGIDWTLGLGGGSSIDTAKAVAAGVPYDGDVWDFFCGKAVIKEALPIAVILTCPATGSESGAVSVINNAEIKVKALTSNYLIRPTISFMNPELSLSLPPYTTACGVVDMFSHIMERYFTDDDELNVIDYMAEGLMKAVVTYGRAVHKDPQDYDARAQIMWIGTVAHNNTVGVGRNQDWSVHNIANELSALYDTPHGATLSIITPYWMKYVYKEHLWRFERFAEKVFDIPHGDDPEKTALAGIEACTGFFRELGMPTRFSENRVEIPTDKLDVMSRTASRAYGSDVIGSFKVLNYDDILTIFKAAAH